MNNFFKKFKKRECKLEWQQLKMVAAFSTDTGSSCLSSLPALQCGSVSEEKLGVGKGVIRCLPLRSFPPDGGDKGTKKCRKRDCGKGYEEGRKREMRKVYGERLSGVKP